MTARQTVILNALKTGPISSVQLADAVDAVEGGFVPTASIRRDIQAIRRAGFLVDDARDNDGLYRLHNAVQQTPATI